jgi:DNA-binding transcriptional LysR family regulator
MNQNWDDMRFFLALCRHQSFVSAAIELKITHSTVARRISALEASLQTQLFQRSEKGCRLTPAGEMLLPYAEQLESTVIKFQETVSGKNNQLSGAIRIGAPDGIGNCFLASCLSRFQSMHPALEVELIAAPMYYSLSKREIDILITVKKPTVGNVVIRKLTRYKLGLFATEEYLTGRAEIKKREDLRAHRIIGYIDDLLFDHDLRFMEEIASGLKTNFRSSTVVTQMNAMIAGGGIGVLPYFMANRVKTLIPVLPENNIERAFWLQVNSDSRQLARVRKTIDFIVNQIEENPDLFLSLAA